MHMLVITNLCMKSNSYNVSVCIHQPLLTGWMCHTVNSKAGFKRFKFRVFLLLDWLQNQG